MSKIVKAWRSMKAIETNKGAPALAGAVRPEHSEGYKTRKGARSLDRAVRPKREK